MRHIYSIKRAPAQLHVSVIATQAAYFLRLPPPARIIAIRIADTERVFVSEFCILYIVYYLFMFALCTLFFCAYSSYILYDIVCYQLLLGLPSLIALQATSGYEVML